MVRQVKIDLDKEDEPRQEAKVEGEENYDDDFIDYDGFI